MTTLALEDLPGVTRIFEHAVTGELASTLDQLAAIDGDPGTVGLMIDHHRVEQLGRLERIKAAAAAAQARITVELEASQLAQQDAAGVRASQRGRGISDQVALARGVPASQGNRHLGLTPRRVERAAKAMAAELDPASVVRRAAKAKGDRRVTIRPAPDTMAYVTGLLPVAQGVAVWANLKHSAAALKAAGDERTEAQLMADLFVQRLTGQEGADTTPVEVQLVMTPDSLVGASDRPARIGEHVVPAQTARDLALDPRAPRWLRRVFTDPASGTVTGADPRRRRFSPAQARFVDTRDQTCRHPGCDGAIADRDHVQRVADGGPTTLVNGQGLCEAHNLVKELPGWTTRVVRDPRSTHTVQVGTPTGHTYRSHAPPALPPAADPSLAARRRE